MRKWFHRDDLVIPAFALGLLLLAAVRVVCAAAVEIVCALFPNGVP